MKTYITSALLLFAADKIAMAAASDEIDEAISLNKVFLSEDDQGGCCHLYSEPIFKGKHFEVCEDHFENPFGYDDDQGVKSWICGPNVLAQFGT